MPSIGRYQIIESLGQGGMGTVYKAFDPLLARVVAVKVISAQLGAGPEHHERFFREARAAAHLSHRNIITIHDLGEENGAPYLAMEFLEGQDLDAKMHGDRLTLARKLEIALGICDGLAHAHACGVIHRDIKPANIFITGAGEVKILDFGLARLVTSEMTRSSVMLGTVNYMAPEQIRAERPDHRADVFSLGVVLYELFGGRRAFSADSFASTLYKILQEEPEPLDRLYPDLPPRLSAVVRRAMAKAREDRYQQVADLGRDLELVYAGLGDADPGFVRGWDGEARRRPPSTRPGGAAANGDAPTLPVGPLPADAPTAPSGAARAQLGPAASPMQTPSAADTGRERPPRSDPPAASRAVPPADALPSPQRRRWRPAVTLAAVCGVLALTAFALALWHGRSPAGAASPRAPETDAASPVAPPPPSPAVTASPPASEQPPVARAVPSMGQAPTGPAEARDLDRAASDRALRAARAALESQRYGDASRLVEGLLGADPSNREAQQLRSRLAAEMRSHADRALGDMDAARRDALAAGARAAVPDLAAAAERREAEARQAYGERRYADAAGRSEDARSLYRDAEAAARRHRAEDAERTRAAQTDARPATPPPEPREPPAPATSAPIPPPAPPPAAPPPAADAPAPAQVVPAIVERYRAALEQRDVAALHDIWPGLGGAQEAAIRADFDNARSIEVAITGLNVEVSGTSATATGLRRYVVHTRDGHRLQSDTVTTILLRKVGPRWVIDSMRHQPVR